MRVCVSSFESFSTLYLFPLFLPSNLLLFIQGEVLRYWPFKNSYRVYNERVYGYHDNSLYWGLTSPFCLQNTISQHRFPSFVELVVAMILHFVWVTIYLRLALRWTVSFTVAGTSLLLPEVCPPRFAQCLAPRRSVNTCWAKVLVIALRSLLKVTWTVSLSS